MHSEQDVQDVIVIGGSAAGLSAALMLGRARRRVLVVDSGTARNRFADHMHGVVGFEGTPPAQLIEAGRRACEPYDVVIQPAHASAIVRGDDHVEVVIDGAHHRSRALVLATGATDTLPDVPGLGAGWGTTVLHCPYCHGWEVRERRLGVLMSSPMGAHHALLVRQWSDDLTVFTNGQPLDGDTRRRLAARHVTVVDGTVTAARVDGRHVTALSVEGHGDVPLDAVFVQPELHPNDDLVAHLALEREDTPVGSFLRVDAQGRTSDPLIWAVGNVRNPMANVPVALAEGTMTGAMVNMALVQDDFDRADRGRDAGARHA